MTFGKLTDPALLTPPSPSPDATAPDDDAAWRDNYDRAKDAGAAPEARKAALLEQCEQRVERAWSTAGPQQLATEIETNSCTALKGGRSCVKCRMCPVEGVWAEVSGYYKPQKNKIFICAEKAPSQDEVETTLVHQLSVAYDHCRQGMRVPFVGIQAPWALSCAATACAEVRGYLRESMGKLGGSTSPFGGGGSSFSGMEGSGLLTDGNLSGDGNYSAGGSMSSDGSLGAGTPPSPADPERWREAIYAAAYTSLSQWGTCAQERRAPRGVLDAVFNACMDDTTPNGRRHPSGAAFPPMPPVVAEADKIGTPVMASPPQPGAPTAGDEHHRPKQGEV